MGACDSCIKYLLFIFNLVFTLSGLAIIIVGGILLANGSDFDSILTDIHDGIKAPQITLIVLGSIIFVIAFLGCCGAIRESKCMLITFAVLLLAIFIVELAIGIYAVVNFQDLQDEITKAVNDNFSKLNNPDVREAFSALEKSIECCGTTGASSYTTHKMLVPDSCCVNYSEGCAQKLPSQYWSKGCISALTDFTSDAGKILGGVAIALSFIEVVGAIIALRLANKSR